MRRLLIAFFFVLLFVHPAQAAWNVVQSACTGTTSTDACSTATCNITGLTSITAGNTIQITAVLDSSTVTAISSMTNETIVAPAGLELQVGAHGIAMGYVLSAVGGWTSTTLTLTQSNNWNVCVTEYHTSVGGAALDSGASGGICTSTITSAAPVSCSLTVSGANLTIGTGIAWGGNITGVTTYTNFIEPNGNGLASRASTTSGTGASWTPTTSNTGVSVSVGFKESAGGGGTSPAGAGGKMGFGGKAGL